MDFEKKNRLRNLKVIVSEAIMVVAVIIMVTILAFIVSGYWVNADFEVKRQGMLQIASVPTGADVAIDGESAWLQRTNTSKVLESGEHTIALTKEGYDSWTKTINISEGLLYRISYPRLFLQNRSLEKLFSTAKVTSATVSPDHETMLLINSTTEWSLVNLMDEKLSPQKLDVAGIFSNTALEDNTKVGAFTSEIISINWSLDGSRALFHVHSDGAKEWVILDFNNPKNSVNLTKQFGANFDNIKIFDRSANTLLAVQNNNLHKIDVSGRSISAILVENIKTFDYHNNEIFFIARAEDYYLGKLKLGDDKITQLAPATSTQKVLVTRFYEDKLILSLNNNTLTLYNMDDLAERASYELTFAPETMKVGHGGEFVIFSSGQAIATLDMEANLVREWTIEGETFGWLDNSMLYTAKDGELIVYDYDGLNRRLIAKNVSSHFPVSITDDRYLYYFSDDLLVREWLIPARKFQIPSKNDGSFDGSSCSSAPSMFGATISVSAPS